MHLYIHIPFCQSKCFYCAFTSLRSYGFEKAYFNALLKDLRVHFEAMHIKTKSIETLFIGGGTPSVIKAGFYEPLFTFLMPYLKEFAECSIEANPHSSHKKWLKMMKEFGINRISFGAQSFDEKKLSFLGRIHKVKDIFTSVEYAKSVGFDNINVDMIYNTKLDTKKMLDFELLHLAKLELSHISAYHLTLEKNTAFDGRLTLKKNAPLLMKHFIQGIINLGFRQYEVSNFGRVCKHNLAYWQGKEYLGCGLSAVSFYDKKRFYTHKSLKNYLKEPNFRQIESLNDENLLLEHLFLGLRSCVGIDEQRLNATQKQKAFLLVQNKKLDYKHGRFYNTDFMLSDELALFLST